MENLARPKARPVISAYPGNLCATLYGCLSLFLPRGQSQRTWDTTLECDFFIYWIGATRDMSRYHAIESALCRLSSHSVDVFFKSYDLMAVSVTNRDSINSYCTVNTGYSVSFPVHLFVMRTVQHSLFVRAFITTIAFANFC